MKGHLLDRPFTDSRVSLRNQASIDRTSGHEQECPVQVPAEEDVLEPAIETSQDDSAPVFVRVDAAMVRGLGRAAARYEESGRMVQADGSLWDDESRTALAKARELGLAPPRHVPDWRDRVIEGEGEAWAKRRAEIIAGPPSRTVTGPLLDAMLELQRASITLEDAYTKLKAAQQEHTEKTALYCRLLVADGRAK